MSSCFCYYDENTRMKFICYRHRAKEKKANTMSNPLDLGQMSEESLNSLVKQANDELNKRKEEWHVWRHWATGGHRRLTMHHCLGGTYSSYDAAKAAIKDRLLSSNEWAFGYHPVQVK